MAFENFKAKIWSKAIDRELERAFVFADGTNQSYSGEIKGLGDTVRILGMATSRSQHLKRFLTQAYHSLLIRRLTSTMQ